MLKQKGFNLMPRRLLVLICVSIITSTYMSCSMGSSRFSDDIEYLEGNNVIVSLLPSDESSYDIDIYYWDENFDYIDDKLESNISAGATGKIIPLNIPENAVAFSLFLFSGSSSDPEYFQQINLSQGIDNYTCSAWLDYSDYFSDSEIKYGISFESIQPLTEEALSTINFIDKPYYLFEVGDDTNPKIWVGEYVSTGSPVSIRVYDDLDDIPDRFLSFWNSGEFKTNLNKKYVLIEAETFDEEISIDFSYNISNIIELEDDIVSLISTDDPKKILGLTKDSHKLLVINPKTKTITESVTLPLQNLSDLAYSDIDETVYAICKLSGKIVSYNFVTKQTVSYDFDTTRDSNSFAINTDLRRVYVHTGDTYDRRYFILDLDNNLNVIDSNSSISAFRSFVYGKNGFLYAEDKYDMMKLSVIGDVISETGIVLDDTSYNGYGGLQISHDGSLLVTPDFGYNITVLDTNDFSIISSWNLGAYTNSAYFSSDDEYILATKDYDHVYISPVNDFSKAVSVYVPEFDYSEYIYRSNSDNSVITGFAGGYDDPILYFVDFPQF